ncbi:MAG: NUDIX hydrolase [Chloroflexi bacterium]|nr:NUDIX hydrolase [Chloroflexota bacterium]
MSAAMPVKDAVSAGGVVWRRDPRGDVEVVLCGRTAAKLWGLPKGTPDTGETLEATALREVQEETGLLVELGPPLGTIDYWFVAAGARYHKVVHHWLMSPTGGDVALHDHEFDDVRWFPIRDARRALTYDNERDILARAEPILRAAP